MKNFAIKSIVSFFIFLILAASATALLAQETSPTAGRAGGERTRKSPGQFEKYVDLNEIGTNQTNISELRCRGGDNLNFAVAGSKTHSSGAPLSILELSFSPSLQATGANSGGLQPGECAFTDRAFYLDEVGQIREPLKIRFETPANAQLKQTQSGSATDKSPTAAESYPDANTIPIYLANSNRYWSFFVSNAGQGYFEARSHRHWKKTLNDKILPKVSVMTKPF